MCGDRRKRLGAGDPDAIAALETRFDRSDLSHAPRLADPVPGCQQPPPAGVGMTLIDGEPGT